MAKTSSKHKPLLLVRLLRWAVALFFGSSLLAVAVLRFVPVYVTPLMLIRCYEQRQQGDPVRMHHRWVSLSEMSPYLPIAVIASEDQRFFSHHGFDFEAIREAAKRNREGGKVYGASTITQQTAKNVFLWQGRSWLRKGLEAYFTVLIELMWSKERILEVYLNSIEMGPGIYGAQAVANDHFNKDAKDLFRSECALIAATLPNPLRFSSAQPSEYMMKRRVQIEKQMR